MVCAPRRARLRSRRQARRSRAGKRDALREPQDTLPSSPSSYPPPPPFEGGGGGRARRVIVVGGGRGGVGKTLLAVNLGVYFAQLGRDVVVCDADPFGSNLHAVLGLDSPPLASTTAVEE